MNVTRDPVWECGIFSAQTLMNKTKAKTKGETNLLMKSRNQFLGLKESNPTKAFSNHISGPFLFVPSLRNDYTPER